MTVENLPMLSLLRSDGQDSPCVGHTDKRGWWGGASGEGLKGVKVDHGVREGVPCPSRAGRGAWPSRDGAWGDWGRGSLEGS